MGIGNRKAINAWAMMIAFVLCFVQTASVSAQNNGPIIIRDTEIENIFKLWTADIFKAADMEQDNVNIVLVQSPQINAFVAGGANIFFYTGLIMKTEDPGELIGVFAHELGHITGGHLIRGRAAMERASFESILGMVLGIGAAIATGNSAAANAIIAGSSSIATSRFLSHSRLNESAADQAALTFFEEAQMDPGGMASFLRKLEDEELLPASQQSEYVRTHPITANRVHAAEARANSSVFINKGFPPLWHEQHARMKAKLLGFISPERVQWVFDDRNTSIPAEYARAIAAYRMNNVDLAVERIDGLIAREPDNPYFKELKGQMLVDFGRIEEAIPYYEAAAEALPNSGLIRIALAHAIIERSGRDEARLKQAIDHLERALLHEKRSTRAQRLLATAYGRSGREDIAKLHLAEEALLQRRIPYARAQAEAALETLPEGSREWIKARDILTYIETQNPEGN